MNSANGASSRVGNFRTFLISREVNAQPSSTDSNIARLVGNGKRVLELGCGSGHMSRALCGQGCTVVGIEIHPEAAQSAAVICERVIVGDLDYLDFDRELGSHRFDVILAADVLEHLKDPLSVLQTLKRFLLPSGHVVISVPNVAHISVRLALLSGRFPYGETGLLDQTHLRFLTRESLEKLMKDAELAIGHFERITNSPGDPATFEVPYDPAIAPPALLEEMMRDPEALTYQFVVSGYPLPESGLVFIQDRIRNLAHEADAARNEASRLSSELQQVRESNDRQQTELDLAGKEIASLREKLRSAEMQSEGLSAQQGIDKAAIATLIQEWDSLKTELAALQQTSSRNEEAIRIAEGEVVRRDEQIINQGRRIAGLMAQVEILLTREKDLRDMLLEAHDQLLKRDEEIALTLASALPQAQPTHPVQANAAAVMNEGGKYIHYQQLLQKIRELVRRTLPDGARVLVVSKGDDDLLRIEPCRGAHFPQRDDGRYSGYYPADGVAAVEHLKALKHGGAQFLLIPQTALWWLDHYREMADYLNEQCVRVIDQPDICLVFDIVKEKTRPSVAEVHIATIAVAPAPRPFGVNVSGNITSEKGVGEAVRSQIRSLSAAGVPIVLNNQLDDTALNPVQELTDLSSENPYAVNLIHLNADALTDFVQSRGKEYFQGRYNIGFWAWETSRFPSQWWDRFQFLDEIWVGSDFVLDAISRVSPIPVVKTPLALSGPLDSASGGRSRSSFGLKDKTFVFLFAFDYMSVTERKNPMGLVQAFRNAFGTRDDATLVLKCNHSEAYSFEAKMLREACRDANIKTIDGVLSREEMNSLMKAADCYVSLHRSEGFGLTMAESMRLGKPVIATAYSGNLEYMTSANSCLVKYRVVEIGKPYGPYREGQWAEPDLDHAADLMRWVFKNRNAAREMGARAQADVARSLSPAATGAIMRNRLLRIAEVGRIAAPEAHARDSSAKSAGNGFYPHLVERIHRIVEANTPVNARVIVISKGDDDLLRFTARQGWHFPQESQGRYAGYYPANDADAIRHLEALREKGGEYFVLPQTAFWWLNHYPELKKRLDARYRRVWNDADCVIYGLTQKSDNGVVRIRERITTWVQR